ncbi:MAG: tRNA 2-thiocytidine(32) synthetase TtcA [Firmicutes bacterium]|nr:tRNA 2-thiocytidine(32) synthetase TtcA [Bacillota bacterium]
MTLQKLLSYVRRACDEKKMISAGDRIAVGLSGGKDSLTLLAGLAGFKRFSPAPFELSAVTVDLGFGADLGGLDAYCKQLEIPFHIVKTDIAEIIFNVRKEKNPCSLCSKMRRGALNTFLNQNGYNKLALGHHADDLVETFFLSLFYEGRLSVFSPVSFMDRSHITLIRPLIYAYEKDIAAFSKGLPIVHNPCPVNHETQREYMKKLIVSICKDIPFAKDRMLSAVTNPSRNNLWEE